MRSVLAGAVATACAAALAQNVPGGDKPANVNTYRLLPHSDSQFAHELLRLGQPSLIKAEEAAAKGTPAENLWKAQLVAATWDTLLKNGETQTATADYLAAMKAYLDATSEGIDGAWALDHIKFICGQFSESILTRLEFWDSGAKDRAALAPMGELADRLLKQAAVSLDAGMKAAERPNGAVDDAAYMRAYGMQSELNYYATSGKYLMAMSMTPGSKPRKDLLLSAADALGEWADSEDDNYVNKQALFLRGKARSEAGDLVHAVEDFNKASVDGPGDIKSPAWVKYQAHYQIIVTRIRAGDFAAANAEYEAFKKTLPADAQVSSNILGYRIAWAEAQKLDGKARTDMQTKALGILADMIKADPRYQGMIFEYLTAQLPDNADVKTLMPMQQLALAYGKSTNQAGDTPASRANLKAAVAVSAEVLKNPLASETEKLEATYNLAACSAILNDSDAALKYGVEFLAKAPKDPRSKKVLPVTLAQIGEIKKAATATGKPLSQDTKNLIDAAFALSTGTFDDKKMLFAQGRMLEDNGKLVDAVKIYASISPDDKYFVQARYRLVAMALTRLSSLTPGKDSDDLIRAAAKDLFASCAEFLKLVDNPPASAPPDFQEHAKDYRTSILITETEAALNPVVKDAAQALKNLDQLDKVKDQLTDLQKGALLRYRIQAYQMNGDVDKIMPLVKDYAATSGQNPIEVFRAMAMSTVQEIDSLQNSNPDQAKRLADFAVKLFDPLIEQEQKPGGNKDNAFELRQVKADMMVRAGDFKGAIDLCKAMEEERPPDIRSYMTEARADFAKAQSTKDPKDYAVAQDYFNRIVQRITPGADSYWECWLRILESKKAQGGPDLAADMKKTISDLKASTSKFGGDAYKDQFERLAVEYGVE